MTFWRCLFDLSETPGRLEFRRTMLPNQAKNCPAPLAIPLPHLHLHNSAMSAEERKALSFVAILLGLSVVARATNRPDPVLVGGASAIDIQTRLQQNQQVRERVSVPPRTRTSGKRKSPEPPPPRRAGPVVIDNRTRTPAVRQTLDLNRASAAELDALPGISPAVAERIVQFRTERGYLVSVEQLDSVKGIGPALLEKIREHVTLR
jgi:competence ComEA-like helix-hairpin-helix protein